MSMMLPPAPLRNVSLSPTLKTVIFRLAMVSHSVMPLWSSLLEFHSGDLLLKSPPTMTLNLNDLIDVSRFDMAATNWSYSMFGEK